MSRGLRTALIVVALAVAVWAVPGGGTGGDTVVSVLSTLIWVAVVLLLVRVYRETRGRVEVLGDAHRLLLYGAIGVLVVAMAARPQLVGTGGGTLLWLVLLFAAAAMVFAVVQRWREVA